MFRRIDNFLMSRGSLQQSERVLVVEWTASRVRALIAARRGAELVAELLGSCTGCGALEELLAGNRDLPRDLVAVSSQARPDATSNGESCNSLLPREQVQWWQATAGRLGRRLRAIYPLIGCALAGLQGAQSEEPRLWIQLEEEAIAALEIQGGALRGIELVEEPPTFARCSELIGEGCEEVWLCGGGVDLSEFGYEIVRSGQTWARIPGLCCEGSGLDKSCAAMVGAARHALRMVASDAPARGPVFTPAFEV